MNVKTIEWLGAGLGLLGATLVSLNNVVSGYGFVAFLLSNLCWMYFGVKTQAKGLLTMQLGFTLTSVMGVYNWLY